MKKNKETHIIDHFFHIAREDTGECIPVGDDIIEQFRPPFHNTIDTYYLEMHSKMGIYFNHSTCAAITTFVNTVSEDSIFLEDLLTNGVKESTEHLVHMIESHIIENEGGYTPLVKYVLRKTCGYRQYDSVRFTCRHGSYYGYIFEFDREQLLSDEFNPDRATSPRYDIEAEKRLYIDESCDHKTEFTCDEFTREVLY